jgi:hypothetical protein
LRVLSRSGNSSDHQNEPKAQSGSEENLPAPPEVKIFPTLMAEPEPEAPEQLINAQHFNQEASQDNDNHGKKEPPATQAVAIQKEQGKPLR